MKISREQKKFEAWVGNSIALTALALRDHATIKRIGWYEFSAAQIAQDFDYSIAKFDRAMLKRTEKYRRHESIIQSMCRLADTGDYNRGTGFPCALDAERFFELLFGYLTGARLPRTRQQLADKEVVDVARILALENVRKITDTQAAFKLRIKEAAFRKRKERLKRLRKVQLARLLPDIVTKDA
jgi:hypothetical protein